jgi:hypothetical protein
MSNAINSGKNSKAVLVVEQGSFDRVLKSLISSKPLKKKDIPAKTGKLQKVIGPRS